MFACKHSLRPAKAGHHFVDNYSVSVRLHQSLTARNVPDVQTRIPAAPWIGGSITTAAIFAISAGVSADRVLKSETWIAGKFHRDDLVWNIESALRLATPTVSP